MLYSNTPLRKTNVAASANLATLARLSRIERTHTHLFTNTYCSHVIVILRPTLHFQRQVLHCSQEIYAGKRRLEKSRINTAHTHTPIQACYDSAPPYTVLLGIIIFASPSTRPGLVNYQVGRKFTSNQYTQHTTTMPERAGEFLENGANLDSAQTLKRGRTITQNGPWLENRGTSLTFANFWPGSCGEVGWGSSFANTHVPQTKWRPGRALPTCRKENWLTINTFNGPGRALLAMCPFVPRDRASDSIACDFDGSWPDGNDRHLLGMCYSGLVGLSCKRESWLATVVPGNGVVVFQAAVHADNVSSIKSTFNCCQGWINAPCTGKKGKPDH